MLYAWKELFSGPYHFGGCRPTVGGGVKICPKTHVMSFFRSKLIWNQSKMVWQWVMKSDILQYHTVGQLGIFQWDSGSVTLAWSISNCSLQNYFENEFFFTQFLAKCLPKLFLIIIFLFLFYFITEKNEKANSLFKLWCTLRPSQQAIVLLNYSQPIKIIIGPSDGETIIPSSRCPTV